MPQQAFGQGPAGMAARKSVLLAQVPGALVQSVVLRSALGGRRRRVIAGPALGVASVKSSTFENGSCSRTFALAARVAGSASLEFA